MQRAAPVTVVARGELTVVHQKMHRFSRNAWEADSSRNNCSRHINEGVLELHNLPPFAPFLPLHILHTLCDTWGSDAWKWQMAVTTNLHIAHSQTVMKRLLTPGSRSHVFADS